MLRIKLFKGSNIINGLRGYVAASNRNIPKSKARIKITHENSVDLQILSDNMLGQNLMPKITIREFIFGSSWHTLLKIENKTKVTFQSRPLRKLSAELKYMNNMSSESPITLEHDDSIRDFTNNSIKPLASTKDISLAKKEYTSKETIYWNKLFAVPQTIWDEFLGYLPNQKVVNLLNLQKHRHLWQAYDYAISTESYDIVIARAKLIGQYHFLMPLTFIDNKLNILDEKIKKDLDAGRFDVKNTINFNQAFTLAFLNKLRFCPTFFELQVFANIVNSYANTISRDINKQRLHTAIKWLPSSTDDSDDFLNVLNFANYVTKTTLSSGRLFFNSKNKWKREFSNHDLLLKLYLDSIFDDLIKRQLIVQANAVNIAINKEIIDRVKEQFQIILTENIGINSLIKLQTSWKNKIPYIESLKQNHATESSSWDPIIAPTEIEGVKIRALSSEKDLYEHGRLMQHCVQTAIFINLCKSKGADILVLESENEYSTLDLRLSHDLNIVLLQHKGVGGVNSPSNLHVSAGIKLVNKMRDGSVKLSHSRVMQFNNPKVYLEFYKYGNLDTQERVYAVYKENKLLPKSLIFDTYQDMLDRTQLTNIIDHALICSQTTLAF